MNLEGGIENCAVVYCEGGRLIGVREYTNQTEGRSILHCACFIQAQMVPTPEGMGLRITCSYPEGDIHLPREYPWRLASRPEMEVYKQISADYKAAQSGLVVARTLPDACGRPS